MEREELITEARQIREKYVGTRPFFRSELGSAELRNLVLEDLVVKMGVELDPRGWGFKNPKDPRIKKASEVVKEIFPE